MYTIPSDETGVGVHSSTMRRIYPRQTTYSHEQTVVMLSGT